MVVQLSLKPPILIVGSMRAGKTTLATAMAQLPGLCRWSEANVFLATGHPFRDSDTADAADAKPWVRRHMNRKALEFQQANGNSRLIIEGPMATLRVTFLAAVFSGLKIIHVVRDGRIVVRERLIDERSNRSFPIMSVNIFSRVGEQLRQMNWRDWPAIPWKIARTLAGRMQKEARWYGTRYPGWRNDRHLGPAQVAATQWTREVDLGLEALSRLPRESWITIICESLTVDPERSFRQLADHCGIAADDAAIAAAARSYRDITSSPSPHPGGDVDVDIESLMPILRPTLERLGYLNLADSMMR